MKKPFYDENDSLNKYLQDILRYDVLEVDEQLMLISKAQKGDEKARNLLISTNLRFVVEVIKRYKHSGISVQEIISEGSLGLFKAIDRFNVKRQNNFISYAVWWIRYYAIQAIQRYGTSVRVPTNKKREIMEIKKVEQAHYSKGEVNPDAVIKQAKEAMGVSEKYIFQLQNLSRFVDSLSQTLQMKHDNENVGTYEDILEDTNAEEPYVFALREEEEEVLAYCLENIPTREAEIIKKRYGIGGRHPCSLQFLSEEYGLTKERIRQLESRGISRMKSIVKNMHILNDVA